MDVSAHFLENIKFQYDKLKDNSEKAISQVTEDQFFHQFNSESDNSIAIIVKHIAGNMRSRWSDFLTSDGEKSTRNRPQEFEIKETSTKSLLMGEWDNSWDILFGAINSLKPDQLLHHITIRSEQHTVLEALHRQLTHYATHIGQIIFIAKLLVKDDWKTLSIPRDKIQLEGGTYKTNF